MTLQGQSCQVTHSDTAPRTPGCLVVSLAPPPRCQGLLTFPKEEGTALGTPISQLTETASFCYPLLLEGTWLLRAGISYWPPNRLCWTLTNGKARFTCHPAQGGHPGQQNHSSPLTSDPQAHPQQDEYGSGEGRAQKQQSQSGCPTEAERAPLRAKRSTALCAIVRALGEQPPCVPSAPGAACNQPALFISATRSGANKFEELDNVTSEKQNLYCTRERGGGLYLAQPQGQLRWDSSQH